MSVALADMPDPVMGDVAAGAVVEIKSGHAFWAERGGGLRADVPVRLSPNEDVERMFWVYGLRGRPSRMVVEVLGDLLDASSTWGAAFDLGSATYDTTRILTGQLDAYVEPGPLLVEEVPGLRAEFVRVGGGAVLNNSPYDLAAAVLVLEEAGAIVGAVGVHATRARGVLSLGMVVLAEFRGRGGGRALLQAALAHARASGAHKVELEVWPDNGRAIALYASAGFAVEGVRRSHYRRRDGSLRSAIVMALLLDYDEP